MNKTAEQRKKKLNRKQLLVLVIMLSVMLIMLISFAWYYFKVDKEVDSEEADVMAPYYLYMLDGKGNSLSLSIGSLHPGETKQVVVGISNKPGKSSSDSVSETIEKYLVGKNSKFEYKMALAYTQNLPITYKVYELKEQQDATDNTTEEDTTESSEKFTITTLSGDTIILEKSSMSKDEPKSNELTVANNTEMYEDEVDKVVNYVQYDLYPKDSSNTALCLETTVSGTDTNYEMDYYLIEMEWLPGIEFSNFIKETDLIYVIVDAVQPKPEEQVGSGT